MIDAREGVTPLDRQYALWARRQDTRALGWEGSSPCNRSWLILLNKAEGIMSRAEDDDDRVMAELAKDVELLGLGDQMAFVSAKNGDGFGELATMLLPHIEPPRFDDDESRLDRDADNEPVVELAIVGRPNVGKSSLLNAMLGAERVVVGPNPGVTRDAVAAELSFRYERRDVDDERHLEESRRLRLVDTAGIRKYSVDRGSSKRAASGENLLSGAGSKGISEGHLSTSSMSSLSSATVAQLARQLPTVPSNPPSTSFHRHVVHLGDNVGNLRSYDSQSRSAEHIKAELQLEQESIDAALSALGMASVVVMVIDAEAGTIRRLELSLAGRILDEGRALVLCANKADLLVSDIELMCVGW